MPPSSRHLVLTRISSDLPAAIDRRTSDGTAAERRVDEPDAAVHRLVVRRVVWDGGLGTPETDGDEPIALDSRRDEPARDGQRAPFGEPPVVSRIAIVVHVPLDPEERDLRLRIEIIVYDLEEVVAHGTQPIAVGLEHDRSGKYQP